MNIKSISTKILDIGYLDEGPRDGAVLFLLHGWPDDIRGWAEVAPLLQLRGYRTIIPFLRGFGKTVFRSQKTIRDASGTALSQDVIDIADLLGIDRFSVIGHDWGARAAYTLAALFPERLITIAALALPYQPGGKFTVPAFGQARLFWYQWFMITDAGAEAVKADPVGFAKIQWETWSPAGWFMDKDFLETAESFKNDDWANITLNGYRRRFKWEVSDPAYDHLRAKLSVIENITVPTLMIQGGADTCDEPGGSEHLENYFENGYERIVIDGAGHFPMREAPEKVGEAILLHLEKYK